MKWLWISGWAVAPDWLAEQARVAWPGVKHSAVSPSRAEAAIAQGNFDALGGYSLGSLWLLKHAQSISAKLPVVLLAPIFAFPAEAGRGGKIALAQLRLQRRRLRRDAGAAITDFFQRAGLGDLPLPLPDKLAEEEIAELDEELGWLENWRAPWPPQAHWHGFIGENDLLLEAASLQKIWPALQIVSGAGHAPGPLLQAAAKNFRGVSP